MPTLRILVKVVPEEEVPVAHEAVGVVVDEETVLEGCDLTCLQMITKKNRVNSALLCTLPPEDSAVGYDSLPPWALAVSI